MQPWLVIDLVAAVVLLGLRLRLTVHDRKSTVDEVGSLAVPDTSLDRATTIGSWAAGSRADWDRHVRPVLAREFGEILRARRDPGAVGQRAGEQMFGARLWPLVDPNQPFRSGGERPGPGREALAGILDRLERL